MIREKIKKNITENELIKRGDIVILGLSGGPDSVCLFSILNELREELGFDIMAAHVNHMMRGEEADRDERYCRRLCELHDIKIRIMKAPVSELAKKEKRSFEDMARKVRYEFFYEIAEELVNSGRTASIATAHNLDDQAETILMRVMRGTGIKGLSAMGFSAHSEKWKIIRPMLNIRKEDIVDYCRDSMLKPCSDKTNLETIYARNKVRLELIPYIERNFNPNISDSIYRLGEMARRDEDYFGKQVDKFLEEAFEDISLFGKKKISKDRQSYFMKREKTESPGDISFNKEKMKNLHPAIRSRVIYKVLEDIGMKNGMTYERMEECDYAIREGITGKMIELPGGFVMHVSHDAIVFCNTANIKREIPSVDADGVELNFDIQKTDCFQDARFGKMKVSFCKISEKQEVLIRSEADWKCVLDYEKLKDVSDKLVIRTRKSGDKMIPLGMNNYKKIKDIFIDDKVPQYSRDRVYMICCGNEVLVIPGMRISENVKVEATTRSLLLLEYWYQI